MINKLKEKFKDHIVDFFNNMTAKNGLRIVSPKGLISVMPWGKYGNTDGDSHLEIYSLEGNLFEAIERFDTVDECEKRIRELLGLKE